MNTKRIYLVCVNEYNTAHFLNVKDAEIYRRNVLICEAQRLAIKTKGKSFDEIREDIRKYNNDWRREHSTKKSFFIGEIESRIVFENIKPNDEI